MDRLQIMSREGDEVMDELEVRTPVKQFSVEIEKKLRKNDHRGGWKDCKNTYLLSLLKEHVKKLEDDLINQDDSRIIPSSADLGAIAMMIADNARKETNNKEGENNE